MLPLQLETVFVTAVCPYALGAILIHVALVVVLPSSTQSPLALHTQSARSWL